MAQTKQDIIEKRFSASLKVKAIGFNSSSKVVKYKAFHVKKCHLKFPFSSFAQFAFFCQVFKQIMFIIFIDVWPLCYQWNTVSFYFGNVIRINLVPSIRLVLTIGSIIWKHRLLEGLPIFVSIFPFVNLKLKSIV